MAVPPDVVDVGEDWAGADDPLAEGPGATVPGATVPAGGVADGTGDEVSRAPQPATNAVTRTTSVSTDQFIQPLPIPPRLVGAGEGSA